MDNAVVRSSGGSALWYRGAERHLNLIATDGGTGG